MTKKESLQLSIILWNWLVDYPQHDKRECPKVEATSWDGDCALCQYTLEVADMEYGGKQCEDCPMWGCWPMPSGYSGGCYVGAYDQWEDTYDSLYDQAFFALILVEAFERRLVKVYQDEYLAVLDEENKHKKVEDWR